MQNIETLSILKNVWDKWRSLARNVVELFLESPSKPKFPSLRDEDSDSMRRPWLLETRHECIPPSHLELCHSERVKVFTHQTDSSLLIYQKVSSSANFSLDMSEYPLAIWNFATEKGLRYSPTRQLSVENNSRVSAPQFSTIQDYVAQF